ncbi:MAG: hypothetical protein PUC26_04700 [Eubacteriales bacterium]|jgi:membrane protein DedA with SNARE-associated domain|nr:hypothetical protein [Eubacteriales bacterium]
MGKSLAGNIIYFWIFVIGALFFGKIFGVAQNTRSIILLILIAGGAYWIVALVRYRAKKRREQRDSGGRS